MLRPFFCSAIATITLLGLIPAAHAQTGAVCQTQTLPSPIGVTAISASAFLDTLGVVTHAGQGYSTTAYTTPLTYTGIRNIRDSGPLSALLTLHQQTGVKVNAIWADGTIPGLISLAKSLAAAGALASIEGPNEPNNQQITYNGVLGGGTATWLPVAQYMRDLHAAKQAEPTLASFPLLDTTETGAEQDNVGLQFLTIPAGSGLTMPDGTVYADVANLHNYVSDNHSYNDNQAWNASDKWLQAGFDGFKGEYGGTTWLKGYAGYNQAQSLATPVATTETGYDTVLNPGGERVQGIVDVNTYLAQFKRGYVATYIYNMRDGEGSSDNLGIYNADWTPKLAATYIHNLTTILASSATSSLTKLNYSIPSEPSTVHDLLLQKADGTFELVVWGEAVTASNPVTVNLGGTHSTVNVYDITNGTSPVQTLSNVASVPLTLTDHALIVETR